MATRVTDLRGGQGEYAALDDRMLVLDFQAGQPEAFVEIHRRYGGLARHVCNRFFNNTMDSDEAFQETMVRVFQGLYRFNGRYALQPWIARIATNVSLDMLRTQARRPALDDDVIELHEREDPGDGPEALVERLVERDLVLSVLSDLPETHRNALVLRELEGRSHREIAHAMGISPSQAKALIHRAKGTFRRGWLAAVTEKGGLAGVALLPLLWLARAGDFLKKVADRGSQAAPVAQAATPEVVTSMASSPAAAVAASGIGERVVAAGMTLLLAGGVTVGAATIGKDRDERPAERAAVVAPAPETPADTQQAPVDRPAERLGEPAAAHDRGRAKGQGGGREDADQGQVAGEDPAGDVTEEPVGEDPVADPSPEPDGVGEPLPDPVPVVPPAPEWSYAFTTSTISVETCECEDSAPTGSQRAETIDDDGTVEFSQVVRGGVLDADGDASWPFSLQQWGTAGPEGGSLDYRFRLVSAGGDYQYWGSAVLSEVAEREDGSRLLTFSGTFGLMRGDPSVPGVPSRGFVTATVGIWQDGTIYTGSFALSEAAPLAVPD